MYPPVKLGVNLIWLMKRCFGPMLGSLPESSGVTLNLEFWLSAGCWRHTDMTLLNQIIDPDVIDRWSAESVQ